MLYPPLEDAEREALEPDYDSRGLSNTRAVSRETGVDQWLDAQDEEPEEKPSHPLDSASSQKLHARLLGWFQHEMEVQGSNRYQMALDADFYDSMQWSEEEAQVLIDRRQAPLVYNQIKVTVDWLLGTERRTKMDFKVLPREEDDVKSAEAKTKLLKYEGDVNKTVFARSRAFADAVKAGMGIVEDGVRGDPTESPLFSRHETWRNCLHDSSATELDMSDARFFFRWKWIDLDVAEAYFPQRKDKVRAAAMQTAGVEDEYQEDFWYLGAQPADTKDLGLTMNRQYANVRTGRISSDASRERVKLIECWYRIPVPEQVMYDASDEAFEGVVYDASDAAMREAVKAGAVSLYDRVKMAVHCAVFTEDSLLQNVPSPYRHNRFPFTIIWAYRRQRDNLPYSPIRAIRDPQMDLNKRFSKSLHILSSRQIIMDKNAVDDVEELREEAAAPDGIIVRNQGKALDFVPNELELQHQVGFISLNTTMIREIGGVNGDNLGIETGAKSGKAIIAKQEQGGMVTAELFDNLRLAFQLQGEIQLSLIEQYWTERKAVRVMGSRGKMEWLRVNTPDEQGNMLNDITRRTADFVVDEQDFRANVRMAMFEQLGNMVSRMPPEIAMQFLDLVVEVGDIPEKDEFIRRLRQMNGQIDPDQELTPEEQQAMQAKQEEQAKVKAHIERMASLDAADKEADIRKKNVEATVKEAELGAQQPDVQGMLAEQEAALMQQFSEQLGAIQQAAEKQITALSEQLQDLQRTAEDKAAEHETRKAEARHALIGEVSKQRIEQETRLKEAELNNAAAKNAEAMNKRLDAMSEQIKTLSKEREADGKENKETAALLKKIDDLGKQIADIGKQEAKGDKAPELPPINVTVPINIDGNKPMKKTGKLVPDGKGGYIVESQESETKE